LFEKFNQNKSTCDSENFLSSFLPVYTNSVGISCFWNFNKWQHSSFWNSKIMCYFCFVTNYVFQVCPMATDPTLLA